MKIAILGTRGIPNNHGGFEQFAEYLAKELAVKGHDVFVYNSHNHPYKKSEWKQVKIIHKYDPENRIGTAGQFIYDLNCIIDSRKRDYDILLQLGYTSSSIWGKLLPKKCIVVTNMDGLEWKRSKYSKKVQKFLLYAERLAIKTSDHLVSDSIGIRKYLFHKYKAVSTYIPYGTVIPDDFSPTVLQDFGLQNYSYNMLIARLEPENSIEVILDGVVISNSKVPFLVIGKHETKYGEYLKCKYKDNHNIIFVGGIYNIKKLNSLRCYSRIYFHGHTVGGTNPSLLEAMGSKALICAHNNLFNKSILGDDAYFFRTANDVSNVINNVAIESRDVIIENNNNKVKKLYSWENIVSQYESMFKELHRGKIIT